MTDNISLSLEAMAHGGEALGRDADGRVVFVDGGLPGERATVRLTESRERYARGVLAETPEVPSPDRILEPACPHFGPWPERGRQPAAFCGGCQWQHIAYPAQLRYKAEVLHDALRRLGRIDRPTVAPTTAMRKPWQYRNRIRLHVGPSGPGFVAADGVAICPISACPIANPTVVELFEALAGDLPVGIEIGLRVGNSGDRLLYLAGTDEALGEIEIETDLDASIVLVREDGATEVAAGRPYFVEVLADRQFVVPALAFFQVNTGMAEVLVGTVRALLPQKTRTLVDVHSGVGMFAILLADLAEQVYAIEVDPVAVGAAVENASGLENLTLLEADAAEGLDYLSGKLETVIVDPPRAGLDQPTAELLAAATAGTIVYVSCEVSTLARDARRLIAGGWRLVGSWPVDMFPQTYHVESVNLFRKP